MATPVSQRTNFFSTGTSFSVDIGTTQTNDLVLILLAWRVAGTLAISGYTAVGTAATTDNWTSNWFAKVASGVEASPVASTTGTTANCLAVSHIIRGADVSGGAAAAIDAIGSTAGSVGASLTSHALITTIADTTIIHGAVWDATRSIPTNIADANLLAATLSASTALTYQAAASTPSAISTFTWTGNGAADTGRAWAVAIKNDSNAEPPVRMTDGRKWLHKVAGFSSPTNSAPNSIATITAIDGVAMHTATATPIANGGAPATSGWRLGATSFTSTQNVGASDAWVGAFVTIPSADLDGKIGTIAYGFPTTVNASVVGSKGNIVVFVDSDNAWEAFTQVLGFQVVAGGFGYQVIKFGTSTPLDSGNGTGGNPIDWTTISYIGYFQHRPSGAGTTTSGFLIPPSYYEDAPSKMIGGGAVVPVTTALEAQYLQGFNAYIGAASFQGSGQLVNRYGLQLGDGTLATYAKHTAQSYDIPATDDATWKVGASGVPFTIKAASSSNTIDLRSAVITSSILQPFTVDAASSLSASLLTTGLSVIGRTFSDLAGYDWTSVSWTECDTVTLAGGGNMTNCTVTDTASTNAALAITANGTAIDSSTIDVAGTSADYHLELGTAVTAITLTDVTFTGTPATDKVHVLKTTGTVTITISGTTSLVAGDVTSEGATVDIVAPVYYRGLNFTGLVNGSKVKVFTPGTQTVLFGTDSVTGNAFAFDDSTSGSTTVDYTIQKADYLPIRATGVALNGSTVEATGRPDTAITQVLDRAYITGGSTGLTYGSTAVVTVGTNPTTNPGTKTFQLGAASTGQNWYSFWIEQWIDKGDDGEALANVEFPLAANGPNSFTLRNGWTFSDGATSIDYLTRDGLRYTNTSGATTASWCAILTSGAGNKQVRYQQSDGGTTEDGAMVNNEMDQLVQIISDPNGDGNYADGFDRSGYLILKIQAEGYDQAEANVVTLYGTLEDQLYVVGLAPTANGIATGDPALTITLERGTFNDLTSGKTFGVKIVSSASGTDIMRELRYNFGAGGEYPAASGYDGFDWHDLVQTNGSDFKTVRGNLYGTAAVKGVVVYSTGTTLHPDFSLFTADDGTTYAPTVLADISITSMSDAGAVPTRLQIINSTALTAASRANTTAYSVGDIRLRQTGIGSENTAGLYLRCTTAGTSAGTPPTWNTTVGGTTTDGTVVWTTYAVLYYDTDPAATSLADTYIDGEEFLAGETAEIRFAEMNGSTSFKTYSTEVAITAAGFSALVAEEADSVFATFAIDGSTLEATFSPNYTDDYIVLDSNTDFAGKGAFAYYCYTLTTSAGMYNFWGGVTALDAGNIRINTSVLNLYFDESAGFVKQTDDVRIFRDDGLRPALDPTSGGEGIEINWRTPVSVVTTGGSAVLPQDIVDIAAASAAAVVADGKTLTVPKFLGLK